MCDRRVYELVNIYLISAGSATLREHKRRGGGSQGGDVCCEERGSGGRGQGQEAAQEGDCKESRKQAGGGMVELNHP